MVLSRPTVVEDSPLNEAAATLEVQELHGIGAPASGNHGTHQPDAQRGDTHRADASRRSARTVTDYDEAFEPLRSAPLDRPFIVAQLGQSLDGRIATVTGESRWINGDAALDHLHRLRANVDAVLIGVGTAEADDPYLTVRRVPGRNPARVVLDPRGRLRADARCLAADGAPRYVVGQRAPGIPDDVECLQVKGSSAGICPHDIAECLYRAGMRRVLIEGGAWTVSRFLEAGALDRLHVLVAPVILGSGKPGIATRPIEHLADALRPPTRTYLLDGGEVLFDCDMRG